MSFFSEIMTHVLIQSTKFFVIPKKHDIAIRQNGIEKNISMYVATSAPLLNWFSNSLPQNDESKKSRLEAPILHKVDRNLGER